MPNFLSQNRRLPAVVLAAAVLGGCATQQQAYPGVEYRNDRAMEAQVVQQFQNCRTEALSLDEAARETGSAAQFSAAARTVDACLAEVDSHRNAVSVQDRMRLHAVGVANYFRAGELDKARAQLEAFELIYPGRDLYFADSTSFIESFRFLLRDLPPSAAGRNSLVNARGEVKAEVRRQHYWNNH